MKYISITINVALLAMLSFMLYRKGAPRSSEMFFVTLASLAPLSSLFVFFRSAPRTTESENLLMLFLKRRALEEKQRIAELRKGEK